MKPKKTFSTIAPAPRTVLVGVCLEKEKIEETQAHLKELGELARTRGIVPAAQVMQRRKAFCASTKIGKGKVEEVALLVKEHGASSVLFDDQLTPGQVKNLEKLLKCKVWDRTLLILEIFALHARTVQAKTQVALAQYQYLLPRLTRMWSHLSRQGGGGGSGMQGTGEKELETDKRIVQDKIHLLKQKLAVIARQAKVRRQRRGEHPNVALVGYTNAGKSSLMQRLSKNEVYVKDELFATLTTTVRKVTLQKTPFLLADTVGFIRKLPHTLVECFKSTLAEVCEADLLLHVVDYANPQWESHVEVVQETLEKIGAEKVPMVLVLNKIDALPEGAKINQKVIKAYQTRYDMPVVAISVTTDLGLDELRETLYKKVAFIRKTALPTQHDPVVQWTE